MSIKLLLAGYLGCGNFGDDAIMASLYQAVDGNEFDVKALSGNPDETYRQYKIISYPRRDSKAIAGAIAECDVLVFPGGSVFQDATSVGSVYYYHGLIRQAKSKGKKVVMLSQGVGPLTTFLGKRWARAAFSMVDVVAVRDSGSAQAIRDLGARTNIKMAADLSFLLPHTPAGVESDSFNVGGMKTIGIAPRPLGKAF
ncbi:MAG TPA: polysaccharide pyruvyl transferase family protein, partial [Fimbriimonas sp.]